MANNNSTKSGAKSGKKIAIIAGALAILAGILLAIFIPKGDSSTNNGSSGGSSSSGQSQGAGDAHGWTVNSDVTTTWEGMEGVEITVTFWNEKDDLGSSAKHPGNGVGIDGVGDSDLIYPFAVALTNRTGSPAALRGLISFLSVPRSGEYIIGRYNDITGEWFTGMKGTVAILNTDELANGASYVKYGYIRMDAVAQAYLSSSYTGISVSAVTMEMHNTPPPIEGTVYTGADREFKFKKDERSEITLFVHDRFSAD